MNVVLNGIDLGGSGTKEIIYSATGAQPIASTTVSGASASFTITAQGTTTISFHAVDNAGNVEQPDKTFVVKIDTTAPSLTLPGSPVAATATGTDGALVSFSLGASDSGSGLPPNNPTASHASGSLFPLGTTTVNVTATDNAGNTANASFTVQVTYAWSGVLQPINPDGTSVFKAGRTVPVKFALTGESAGITTAVATLSYTLVGSVAGAVNEAADSTSQATTGNQFRYDPTSGEYVFNWDTTGLAAGAYELRIDLGDGVDRTITVGLR